MTERLRVGPPQKAAASHGNGLLQGLLDALPVVLASEQRHVPVVNTPGEMRLIGALVRAEVLGLFSEAIANSSRTEA